MLIIPLNLDTVLLLLHNSKLAYSLVRQRRKCYIIKQYPGKPKGGHFQSLLFSVILQPVRINKPGAPLLGLAKSIYLYFISVQSII